MWTQEKVSEWALATFGPECTPASIACRANVEMGELLREMEGERRVDMIVEEAADVMIVLYRLAVKRAIDMRTLAMGKRDILALSESCDPVGLARKSNVALGQVIFHCDRETWRSLAEAMALLGARLMLLCEQYGRDLWDEIDRKMEINIRRKWALDGRGHGQHVKEDTAAA